MSMSQPHRPRDRASSPARATAAARWRWAVANRVLMLENAVYSILSPEGFASILWKDSARQRRRPVS